MFCWTSALLLVETTRTVQYSTVQCIAADFSEIDALRMKIAFIHTCIQYDEYLLWRLVSCVLS